MISSVFTVSGKLSLMMVAVKYPRKAFYDLKETVSYAESLSREPPYKPAKHLRIDVQG